MFNVIVKSLRNLSKNGTLKFDHKSSRPQSAPSNGIIEHYIQILKKIIKEESDCKD